MPHFNHALIQISIILNEMKYIHILKNKSSKIYWFFIAIFCNTVYLPFQLHTMKFFWESCNRFIIVCPVLVWKSCIYATNYIFDCKCTIYFELLMTGKYISTKLLLKQILLDLVLKFMVQDSLMKKAQKHLLYSLIPFFVNNLLTSPTLPIFELK